jgi:phage major head subunit gpT-like protein
MAGQGLSSRAIIGMFYKRLEQDLGQSWAGRISMPMPSDQGSEEYKWLGQSPQMREWVGGRHAKGLRENGITIVNKKFESTLEIPVEWIQRDKTGQIKVRINEMATRANAHWAKLLSTLIVNAESSVCYDGQYFFDTDHSEGDSGSQSNDISVDISALATSVHGSTTAPSAGELQQCILQGAQKILGFLDDQGEPMNENAREFVVMVPLSLWIPALTAVGVPMLDSGNANVMQSASMDGFSFSIAANARLTSWTDKFAVFRAGSDVSAFIRQEEKPITMKAKAEGSEHEFDTDTHQYGIDARRNVGYGYWQNACLVTMT